MIEAEYVSLNQNTIPQTDTLSFLRLAGAYGFTAVELSVARLSELFSVVGVDELQKTLSDTSITVLSLNAFNETYLTPENNRELLKTDCIKMAQLCKYTGTNAILVPASQMFSVNGEVLDGSGQFDLQVSNLKFMADMFTAKGIETAVEPVGDPSYSFTRISQADDMIDSLITDYNISIVSDIHLQYCAGETPETYHTMKAPMHILHFNDSAKSIDNSPHYIHDRAFPGEGVADCNSWVAEAQKAGFTGYYSLEIFSPEINSMDAEAAIQLCRKKLDTFIEEYNRKEHR